MNSMHTWLPVSNPRRDTLVLAAALAALDPAGALAAGPALIAIRGATVLTATKGTIEGGTVIVRDGKIDAIGKDVPIPEGAKVIEAKRRFLVPGFVDMHSHLG